jgi:hypothetical protein
MGEGPICANYVKWRDLKISGNRSREDASCAIFVRHQNSRGEAIKFAGKIM